MALNRLKLSCTVTPSCSFLLPPPLFSIILLCWSFFCLLVRRLDETRHRTICVVFINAKRRNNVIANFRAFLRIFRERVGKGEERRERVGDRERFLQNRKSPGQPSNPATQRPQRALLRPCLGSIDRDRIVSLLPFHSAAFPANPFFCSMHIYV